MTESISQNTADVWLLAPIEIGGQQINEGSLSPLWSGRKTLPETISVPYTVKPLSEAAFLSFFCHKTKLALLSLNLYPPSLNSMLYQIERKSQGALNLSFIIFLVFFQSVDKKD